MAADGFPGAFVDKETGKVDRLETGWERFEGKLLLRGAEYGLLGLKAVALAQVAPVLALVAVAGWAYFQKRHMKGADADIRSMIREGRAQGNLFDLTQADGRSAFERRYGDCQPGFAEDLMKVAANAGLAEVPRVLVTKGTPAGMTCRSDGKHPLLLLSKHALTRLEPPEMRAVVAHEFTHLKLGHIQESLKASARNPLNLILTCLLLGVGVTGGLPFLPVLGFVVASHLIGNSLRSIRSRQREEICDRGAALITGGTAELSLALKKLTKSGLDIFIDRLGYGRRKPTPKEEAEDKPGRFWKFVYGTHPDEARRDALLKNFEFRHPAFCEKQRGRYSKAFNMRARRVQTNGPANGNRRTVMTGMPAEEFGFRLGQSI
jgi:Zn-dependent protease with chaperone function